MCVRERERERGEQVDEIEAQVREASDEDLQCLKKLGSLRSSVKQKREPCSLLYHLRYTIFSLVSECV